MTKGDSLGDRMKGYEAVAKGILVHRMPVIIRIDGKAFHTFTKHFHKPFSEVMSAAMQETTLQLCKNIQGCVLGYTQSDEITLVLQDYQELNTAAWFDYEIQKLCSISASMATYYFNKAYHDMVTTWSHTHCSFHKLIRLVASELCIDRMAAGETVNIPENDRDIPKWAYNMDIPLHKLMGQYKDADSYIKMFDSRCFNLPKEEVTNCLIWRQQDATRNSIEALGQSKFSHKELHGKNCNMIQDMLHETYNINWNDIPVKFKRGLCVKKREEEDGRSSWYVDLNIPIFTQDRNYVEDTFNF